MQRDDAGLYAKADQKKEERCVAFERWHLLSESVEAGKAVIASRLLKQKQECQNEATGADVGHDKEEHPGAACLGLVVFETDQTIGGERHDFPCNEEKEGVVRYKHERCREQQQVVEKPEQAGVFPPAQVTQRIDGQSKRE